MKTETRNHTTETPQPPTTMLAKFKLVGPGLIVAATGVGAGDLTMAAIIGGDFGWALSWAIVVGAAIKLFLSEGVGRWYLATGKTFIQGWHSLGWIASLYLIVYVILFGIIYGAAAPAVCGLVINAMFPIIPVWIGAVSSALIGYLLVRFGRYNLLENAMTALVGVMFIAVVGSAVVILINLGQVDYTLKPSLPDGSLVRVLAVIGGVGGTLALVCYSYWIKSKGWHTTKWISMMRFDITTAYIITAIFAISVMIIAAELLFGTGISFSGNEGLVSLATNYGDRFGNFFRWVLLIGMFAAVFTSVLGPWHGVSYLFADFVNTIKQTSKTNSSSGDVSESNFSFRAYLFWLTFPPMLLHLLDQPVSLVIIYGVTSAFFMPILALGLLILLNSKALKKVNRNSLVSNISLVLILAFFGFLGVHEIWVSYLS